MCIINTNNIIILGLIFDIVGVLIVAYYGFPTTFLEKKVVEWGFDEKDRKKQKLMSKLGTLMIIIGFLLQLIASIIVM